jgi:GcrA cell cycle regulator
MGDNRSHGWTREREADLKRLWADGHSAGEIARTLGGTTRNAVLGKLHRAGLTGTRGIEVTRSNLSRAMKRRNADHPQARKPRPEPRPRPVTVAAAKKAAAPRKPAPLPPRVAPRPAVLRLIVGGKGVNQPPLAHPPLMLPLEALKSSHCRWPYGEGEAMRFCGCPAMVKEDRQISWCAHHAAEVFSPVQPSPIKPPMPSFKRNTPTRAQMFRAAAGTGAVR